ncbi:hypothetical protein [Actinacidiphila sp. bgisy167]|uniref:hypothetical protein n=1 Tax=Actinacidiphila sp. bgisy167 TaxID=3413797 RepID=UPI003D712915
MRATGAAQFKTAWEHPPTRRAWVRTVLFRSVTLLVWLAALPAWLYAVLLTPVWTLVIWMPVFFVVLYYAILAVGGVLPLPGLRRVLRHYPWQVHPGSVAEPVKTGGTRFVFPDPERSGKTVALRHGGYLGGGRTFWVRGVRAGGVTEVWFAGDPRFIGAVAAPGPARLIRCAQREAVDDRMSARRQGVSPEARERARAAGARVG